MASLVDKLRRYLSSPKGRQVVDKAKRAANDPRNQRKARELLDRLRSRGRR
ncbi:hypothetical protein [Spongiactinospora sp. TRM90649]|uniref:hypothetical protein n=1 Tax=Spongiactinospora sp. TRM90649 TaxID=3031114 RepID=UPI0023F9018E|nr:hypothetical protein [Spongiactinospora sp. TRM90649]MDF5758537.1 hypothetical protein [Spongiactinospora sp. TRM90649]